MKCSETETDTETETKVYIRLLNVIYKAFHGIYKAFKWIYKGYRIASKESTYSTMKKTEELDVSGILDKCLEARGSKPGKTVNVAEPQMKALDPLKDI